MDPADPIILWTSSLKNSIINIRLLTSLNRPVISLLLTRKRFFNRAILDIGLKDGVEFDLLFNGMDWIIR